LIASSAACDSDRCWSPKPKIARNQPYFFDQAEVEQPIIKWLIDDRANVTPCSHTRYLPLSPLLPSGQFRWPFRVFLAWARSCFGERRNIVSNKLYVTNVPISVDDGDLRQLFASYGTVHKPQVFSLSWSRSSSKAGLVEMGSDQEGDAAIAGLDGREYGGRLLTVTWATTRNETDATHSSLFGPMNMTADDSPHERCGIGPVEAGNDRHGGIPYILGDAEGVHLLVAIDHRLARIYKTELHGSLPQRILPFDRNGSGRHLHYVENDSSGQRKPAQRSFYEAIAKTLGSAENILVFGCGTGASSAMDQLLAELSQHDENIARRIVRTVVVDEQDLSEGQLLAKAREFYEKTALQ
jgi:hypothetical protein